MVGSTADDAMPNTNLISDRIIREWTLPDRKDAILNMAAATEMRYLLLYLSAALPQKTPATAYAKQKTGPDKSPYHLLRPG